MQFVDRSRISEGITWKGVKGKPLGFSSFKKKISLPPKEWLDATGVVSWYREHEQVTPALPGLHDNSADVDSVRAATLLHLSDPRYCGMMLRISSRSHFSCTRVAVVTARADYLLLHAARIGNLQIHYIVA